VLGALAASIPAPDGWSRARIAGVVVAALLAGGLQIALALGEVAVRGDSTYGAIMTRERDRAVERELLAWQRAHARATVDERAVQQRVIEDAHPREPPFAPVLALLLVAAVVVGARRARPPTTPVTTRLLVTSAAIAAGTIVVVMTIDAVFH